MKHSGIDPSSDQSVRILNLPPDAKLPANIKYQYMPRIRCNDCRTKLYTAGPGLTVDNFEIHLKNRQHKERVEARRKSSSKAGLSGS